MHDRGGEPRPENIPLAEMPELLKVASELYARDRAEMEQAARRQELLRAAAEAGLPPEYLDRAAVMIYAQRAEYHRRRQRWQMGVVAALALTLGMALLSMQGEPPQYVSPPAAPVLLAPSPPSPPPLPAPVLASHFGLIDLSDQATESLVASMLNTPGNDLSDVGAGIRTLGGVPFNVTGPVLIGAGATEGAETGGAVALPAKVEGIPIGRKAHCLYFLHGTHFSTRPGIRIGSYIIHYQGGSRAEIPLRFGEDVLDWWAGVGPQTQEALNHMVWHGHNDAASRHDTGIRLFMKRWENPEPDTPIETLDMVTGDQPAGPGSPAPFLLGLTAD
jgi:hypothetical protein